MWDILKKVDPDVRNYLIYPASGLVIGTLVLWGIGFLLKKISFKGFWTIFGFIFSDTREKFRHSLMKWDEKAEHCRLMMELETARNPPRINDHSFQGTVMENASRLSTVFSDMQHITEAKEAIQDFHRRRRARKPGEPMPPPTPKPSPKPKSEKKMDRSGAVPVLIHNSQIQHVEIPPDPKI
jgi:hypothetical protein